jgi:hypothetical protein
MRAFRRLFAVLFILSLFVGVVHEITHTHHTGEVCEVCLLAHSPALVEEAIVLSLVDALFDTFDSSKGAQPTQHILLTRNRSPPLV